MGTKTPEPADARKLFEQAGFEIRDAGKSPERIEVRKYNCAQLLERNSRGAWERSGPPCFIVRGWNCELEDRGYQKFWHHQGRRFPIRQNDLKALHQFDEEVRGVLGLKSLYNESLGSTCARAAYDRLNGRWEA